MKHCMLLLLLSLVGSNVFASFSQAHWRWRKDNGSQTSATWRDAQDFPGTIMDSSGIRLRMEIYNSTGDNEMGTVNLQYRMDTTGTWYDVSDTSAGRAFVMRGSSPYVYDGEPTTMQVNDPTAGTFAGGKVLVNTWQFYDTLDAGDKQEFEWDIKPTSNYSLDSFYQFRMTFTGSQDGFAYGTPIPNMMIREPLPNPQAGDVLMDNNVYNFFSRDSGWIASDGTNSIKLSNGKVIWLMDDSFIGNYDTLGGTMPCLFQVRNSVLVQPYNNWNWTATQTLIGDSASVPSYFKNTGNNNYLMWPGAGYQKGDTIYVYCSNIMNSSGGLGFTSGGNDFLGKIYLPTMTVTGFDNLQNFNGISFGIGFDTAESGNYIYTWGYKGSGFITSNVYVARFPKTAPGGPWTFWNGTAWDTSASNAAVIANGASNGVNVVKVRNKYILVSTQFSVACDEGNQIYTQTSDSLMGPFTPQKTIYTIPDDVLGHTPFFYGPVLHPEYINGSNEILLTYDINGYSNCEPFCINNGADPEYYRPRGVRVPLSFIDSSIANSDAEAYLPPHGFGEPSWGCHAFPNPSHYYINIGLNDYTDKAVDFLLYDAMGHCVYKEYVGVNGGSLNHTIYLNKNMAKGTYFLRVQSAKEGKYIKVVIE
jgi:hypothetical protein